MSIGSRKRISKWDLKEDPQIILGDSQYGTWPRKAGESILNKVSLSGRHSPQLAGTTDSEWYGIESNNKDDRDFSDVMFAWQRDGSYSTKMSPGLEDWRQRNHSRSPKIGLGRSYRSRSRSQSRSPSYGFKRESGLDGRRNAAQTCRDFVAGRCRRGDGCPYRHQGDRDYEDRSFAENSMTNSCKSRQRMGGASKYSTSDDSREYIQIKGRCSDFIKGKCYRGAYCKYAHNGAASDKESAKEVFRDTENDRSKYAFSEHSRKHEPHRSGDIPCKFFASGNCRKGKYCRFSHHGQTAYPRDRSRDDWRQESGNSDTLEETGEHLRGACEQRDAAYSRDDRWLHSFNIENRSFGHPTNNDKAADHNKREYVQLKAETNAGTGGFETKDAENWFADMEVSSPWNYGQSSCHIVKEESGHISQTSQSLTLNVTSLQTCEKDITGAVLGQEHQVTVDISPIIPQNASFQSKPSSREDASSSYALQVGKATSDCPVSSIDRKFSASVLPGQCLDQNGHSSSAVTDPLSSFNAVGQNQQTFPLYAPRGQSINTAQNQPLFQEDKSFSNPNVGDGNRSELISEILPAPNIVSREQLSQFSNLSALSQLFRNVQQLPQLGSVPNPPKTMEFVSSSLSSSAGPVTLLSAASIHPNLVMGFERQYDPLSDIIELVKCHNDNPLQGLLPNPVGGKVVADKKPEVLSREILTSLTVEPSGNNTGNSELELDQSCHQSNQVNPVVNYIGEGNNGKTTEESQKTEENRPLEKMNGDGSADKGKKKNDGQGIRAFRFALAEFVKDILKPKWKEGQISKESHKAIVKKVVDKVTGSIQGANIPQSQEKIDNHLSSSKLKLTKLVEAYAEKYQKS